MSRYLLIICIIWTACTNESKHMTVLFAGDLMLDRGTETTIEKYGADYLFTDVKPILQKSDIAIVNFEGTACDTSIKPIDKKCTFRFKPEYLSAIKNAGIHYCNLANNHSCDFGNIGLEQTISNCKQHSIETFGSDFDSTKNIKPLIISKGKTSIAIFSSCFLKQSIQNIYFPSCDILAKQISLFKKQHPDIIVFVYFHWGIEKQMVPTDEQKKQAHTLIDAGADAIIGHHPHVVQSIEEYKGKYIFYSIGNFVFDNNHEPANKGIFVRFDISENMLGKVQIIPFTISASKPFLMNDEDSKLFIKKKLVHSSR